MPRPVRPLISRSVVVAGAVDIIGALGLEAFSLPRLAATLGVRTPSLYHHFRDRDSILLAVARYVAGSAVDVSGRPPGPEWPEHFVVLALNFRRSFLRHRNTAQLLLHHRPRDLLPGGYEGAAAFLRASDVPVRLHIPILDGMETLLIGTVLSEALSPFFIGRQRFSVADEAAQPLLAAAVRASAADAEELLAAKVRAFLIGCLLTDVRGKPNGIRYGEARSAYGHEKAGDSLDG